MLPCFFPFLHIGNFLLLALDFPAAFQYSHFSHHLQVLAPGPAARSLAPGPQLPAPQPPSPPTPTPVPQRVCIPYPSLASVCLMVYMILLT